MALKIDNEPSEYFAWGHPSENNCSFDEAKRLLEDIWQDILSGNHELLAFNIKFEFSVTKKWFGLPILPHTKFKDAMLEGFLYSPYEAKLGLKELATKWLNWPPDERMEVEEWLVANCRMPDGKKISMSKRSDHYAGKYIAFAPGKLVGKYACGDTDRTYALHLPLKQYIEEQGMSIAYARKRELIPILIENEQSGMRIDTERAIDEYEACTETINRIDEWMSHKFGVQEINFNSGPQLGGVLASAGLLDLDALPKTKTGKPSMKKEVLAVALPPEWNELIKYRRQLSTISGTFIKPWIEMALETDGIVYTSWNQVAQERDGTEAGTRTGRLSSKPSFLNIPKIGNVEPPLMANELTTLGLMPLPYVRSLIVPWKPGWVLVDRDYAQQEVRISAHCGGGTILDALRKDEWMSIHKYVEAMLKHTYGIDLPYKNVKTVNFRIFYGGGVKGLMEALHIDKATATAIRSALLQIMPGLAMMYSECERRASLGVPVRTWGGRVYYCEPSEFDRGSRKAYAYRLVNYIIQGSAADNLELAWLNLGYNTEWWRTYLTVHDQFLGSCPLEMIHEGHAKLKTAMTVDGFDVPMLSEGKWSMTNWADMHDYDIKGRLVYGEST